MKDNRNNTQEAPWWGIMIVLVFVLSLVLPLWVWVARHLWGWALQ